jgi:hypothetical protein
LIKQHQSDEEDVVSEEVQLGRDQIDKLCNAHQSTFENYIFNLEFDSKDDALVEVKNYLQEMRNIQHASLEKICQNFLNHWPDKSEGFYFMLKSISLARIRVVCDSSLLDNLTDEEKNNIFHESY